MPLPTVRTTPLRRACRSRGGICTLSRASPVPLPLIVVLRSTMLRTASLAAARLEGRLLAGETRDVRQPTADRRPPTATPVSSRNRVLVDHPAAPLDDDTATPDP